MLQKYGKNNEFPQFPRKIQEKLQNSPKHPGKSPKTYYTTAINLSHPKTNKKPYYTNPKLHNFPQKHQKQAKYSKYPKPPKSQQAPKKPKKPKKPQFPDESPKTYYKPTHTYYTTKNTQNCIISITNTSQTENT